MTKRTEGEQPVTSRGLSSNVEAILARYGRARQEPFGKAHPLWASFVEAREFIRAALRDYDSLVVKCSAGQGRWATVPWISILDSRETTRTSEGVYLIYLFRADLSGVYLTLNQGTAWVMAGYGGQGVSELRSRASTLRERSAALKGNGFEVARGIDLRSQVPLVLGYQDSTVAFKLYEAGRVPKDEQLVADLRAAVATYQKLVPSRRVFGSTRHSEV